MATKSVKDNSHAFWATIICSILVAITSIASAIIARNTTTTYDVREVPTFDLKGITDYFPLKKGNYWIYKSKFRSHDDKDIPTEEHYKVRVDVLNEYSNSKNEGIKLFEMRGHPSDIPKSPSHYGYLIVSNKIFQIREEDLGKVKKAVLSADSIEQSIFNYAEPVIEAPLFKGQRFGDYKQISRPDKMYFYYVNDVTTFHDSYSTHVKSVPIYEVTYVTNPDGFSFSFEPYLGIKYFNSSHHGTQLEVSSDLVEYNLHTTK